MCRSRSVTLFGTGCSGSVMAFPRASRLTSVVDGASKRAKQDSPSSEQHRRVSPDVISRGSLLSICTEALAGTYQLREHTGDLDLFIKSLPSPRCHSSRDHAREALRSPMNRNLEVISRWN